MPKFGSRGLRFLAAILGVVLVLLLGRLGTYGSDPNSESPSSSAGTSRTDDPLSQTSAGDRADGNTEPGSASESSQDAGRRATSGQTLPPDWAFASYGRKSATDPSPDTCSMQPGEVCTLWFLGRYSLATYPTAIIRVGAFEDGSETPAAHNDLHITRGAARFYHKLVYRVSDTAKTVKFMVILVSPGGDLIFRPDPSPPDVPVKS